LIVLALATILGLASAVHASAEADGSSVPATTVCSGPGDFGTQYLSSTWPGGFTGVPVYSNGTAGYNSQCDNTAATPSGKVVQSGMEWQDVELVNRLYITMGWINATWPGDGDDLYGANANSVGLTNQQPQGSITYLAPGDVISFSNPAVSGGRAAIVTQISGAEITLVSQNTTKGSTISTGTLSNAWLFLNGGWPGYTAIGVIHAPLTPAPGLAAVRDANDRDEVFATGPGGVVYQDWQLSPNGGKFGKDWGSWRKLASNSGFTSLTAGVDENGDAEVFATGPGGVVYRDRQLSPNGGKGWSGWQRLASNSGFTSLAAVRDANGRLAVFATGPGGVVYRDRQLSLNGGKGWSGWKTLAPSKGFTRLAAIQDANGDAEVFATGPGGVVYHDRELSLNGGKGWSGWKTLAPSKGFTSLAAVRNANGDAVVLATNPDGVVYHDWQLNPNGGKGWSGLQILQTLGGFTSLAAASDANTDAEVFASGPDGVVYHDRQLGPNAVRGWLGWEPIASSAP